MSRKKTPVTKSSPYLKLCQIVIDEGSREAAAKRLGIHISYLNYILAGQRKMSEKLANKLGFKKVITWEPKDDR